VLHLHPKAKIFNKTERKEMSTISKSLSTKTDANGYTQVLFLVRNGRKSRLRIKSGVFVPEKYWNEKKNIFVSGSHE
jgi:hypothetical protein